MLVSSSRREFLSRGLGGVSSAWVTAHWPAILSAAAHAHTVSSSGAPAKFEFLSPEQAAEVEAISARIIPTTDTPGAREAGVVYFIDRALVTFAKGAQKSYIDGLQDFAARTRELFPEAATFSALAPEQQDEVLESFDEQSTAPTSRGRRNHGAASAFFETIRVHTVMGFLIDPESDRHGNQGAAGWKVIGRDPSHMFQPPFGFYDKDYPGWQPNSVDSDKTKS